MAAALLSPSRIKRNRASRRRRASRLWFPGQRYDAFSDFNYNYFRNYDVSTGRYSQSDPIGLKGGSTFSYVQGAPLQLKDANGLQASRYVISARGATPPSYAPVSPRDPDYPVGTEPRYAELELPNYFQLSSRVEAVGMLVGALVTQCLEDDDKRCEQAKVDATRIYNELQTRSIPQYMYASRHGGADSGHYKAITQGQVALRNAIARVRANCRVDPPDMPKWQMMAAQIFPAR